MWGRVKHWLDIHQLSYFAIDNIKRAARPLFLKHNRVPGYKTFWNVFKRITLIVFSITFLEICDEKGHIVFEVWSSVEFPRRFDNRI